MGEQFGKGQAKKNIQKKMGSVDVLVDPGDLDSVYDYADQPTPPGAEWVGAFVVNGPAGKKFKLTLNGGSPAPEGRQFVVLCGSDRTTAAVIKNLSLPVGDPAIGII